MHAVNLDTFNVIVPKVAVSQMAKAVVKQEEKTGGTAMVTISHQGVTKAEHINSNCPLAAIGATALAKMKVGKEKEARITVVNIFPHGK